MLYLIQHTSPKDYTRYRVRAYDLAADRLLQRPIVDRARRARRWRVYRSRDEPRRHLGVHALPEGEGDPFVHALDAFHRSAVLHRPGLAGDLPSWRYGAPHLVSKDGRLVHLRQLRVNGSARRRHYDARDEGLSLI